MRLVANLLCETDWAGASAPDRITRAAADLGTLMGALARGGDTVWTPLPVDAERVTPGPGLPAVALETGPLDALPPLPTIAWGETETTARVRPAECAVRGGPATEHWLDVLRSLRVPTAATHRRVCDRRRQLAFAKRERLSLPGSYTISRLPRDAGHPIFTGFFVPSSMGRLLLAPDQVFGEGGGDWVVKAPWTAAGRERLRGRGWPPLEQECVRLERLFDRHGELVVEPWCERLADFGSIAMVANGVVRRIGFHATELSGGGAFRGLRPLPERVADEGLTVDEVLSLHAATQTAGAWLAEQGYEGPFGLDAWRYRAADGTVRFHALGELNARLTFGFVARRLAEGAGWDPRGETPAPALRVGSAADLAAAAPIAVLLRPGSEADLGAWLVA